MCARTGSCGYDEVVVGLAGPWLATGQQPDHAVGKCSQEDPGDDPPTIVRDDGGGEARADEQHG